MPYINQYKRSYPKGYKIHNKPVTHISSNIESLEHGFVDRKRGYGTSFARIPDEEMSVPELREPEGTAGRVHARITGVGLDYNIPEHRKFIDSIMYKQMDESSRGEIDFIDVGSELRSLGFDFVENWQSIGEAPELHVINEKVIKIDRIEPLKRYYGRINMEGRTKEQLRVARMTPEEYFKYIAKKEGIPLKGE